MAVIIADGFPWATGQAAEAGYTYGGSGLTVETATPRSAGGRYIQFSANPDYATMYLRKSFGSNPATACVQFGYKGTQYVAGKFVPVGCFLDNDTEQISIRDYEGVFKVYCGSNLLGTASPISVSTWHQIELKVLIDASAGTVLLKADGVTLLNLTGQDTQNTANAYVNQWEFGCHTNLGISANETWHESDLVVMDTTGTRCNDLLGPAIVKLCMPTGAGNYSQWSPGLGRFSPTMVDDDSPAPYVVTESAYTDSYRGWKVFDQNAGAGEGWYYNSLASPQWIKIDCGSATVLTSYKLTSMDNDVAYPGMPISWTLEGSNNNSDWVELDEQTNVTYWGNAETRTYVLANTPIAYRYYRLTMTQKESSGYGWQVKEWELWSDNFTKVDEVPKDDADYISADGTGKKDTYAVDDVPAGATVHAAIVTPRVQSAAAAATVRGIARHSSTDGNGPDKTVPASWNWVQSPIYVNPSTNQPFTAAEFNAAEFGIEKTA